MASNFNIKSVHRDGKSELKIGVDENAKIIDGIGKEILIKNEDGSPAKIAVENIPYMPENISENNKLVTQSDLEKMKTEILKAYKAQAESLEALMNLEKIVGGLNE